MKFNYNLSLGSIEFNTNNTMPTHLYLNEQGKSTVEATSSSKMDFAMRDITISGSVDLELMELKEILTNDGLNVDKILSFLKNDLHDVIAKNGEVMLDLNNKAKEASRKRRIEDAKTDNEVAWVKEHHQVSDEQ